MDIRKWVKFVLDPQLEQQKEATGLSVHSISILPELLSEAFATNPGETERRILESFREQDIDCESVHLDLFNNPATVSIVKKSYNHLSPIEADSVALPSLLGESAYARMRQYGIYKFGCLIEYETTFGDDKRGLDDIVSDIRAIPTVTIVSVVLANEKISTGRYVAGLQIKFIPSFPGSLTQPEDAKGYILRTIKKIKNVKGISRVTLKTDRIE